MCPITAEIMTDPVCMAEGSYEREAISEWFRTKDTSPVKGTTLESKSLLQTTAPQLHPRSLVEAFAAPSPVL